MMQGMKTFRLPKSSKNQKPSYLILVFDGTGSMGGEFDLMIEAYKSVFKEQIKSNQVHTLYFGYYKGWSQIGDAEPHFDGGNDFTSAFQNVLQKLGENIQADITICVVSDGHEPSNIQALKQQIDATKKNYQIQFTSIAVGSGYPYELFQSFRDHFHNGAVSCTTVQLVERSKITGKDECRKNFINTFEMVRSQLSQKQKVYVNQQVWEALNAKPSFYALQGSVVTSMADKLTTNEGIEINETRQVPDVAEFIQTSCQEFLKVQSTDKYKGSMEQAKQMKQVLEDLFKRVDQSTSQNKEYLNKVVQQIQKDLVILEYIGVGKLELQNLSDSDKTKLLSDFNPQKAEIQMALIEEQELEIQESNSFQQQDNRIRLRTSYFHSMLLSFLASLCVKCCPRLMKQVYI